MHSRPPGSAGLLLLCVLVLTGCTSRLNGLRHDALPGPAELLRAEPLTGPNDVAPLPDPDLLRLSPEMRAFLAGQVSPRAAPEKRLDQLVDGIMGADGLGLRYGERSLTAAEAFREREVNCLSFTSMVVALGREAGLDVRFQEVDIPPDWSSRGASLVLNRHIDAWFAGTGRVVDFNIEDYRSSYARRVIADARAEAHFHANKGVEHLQEGAVIEALRHFRQAIARDPSFGPAWINLGVLYLRAGHPREAEAAWLQALRAERDSEVALSNLERLYRQQGDATRADELAGRIARHRLRNPYYQYQLALQAFGIADYRAAIAHLREAVRLQPAESRFAALLALSYLRMGDRRQAGEWLARASELTTEASAREAYLGKIGKLRAGTRG